MWWPGTIPAGTDSAEIVTTLDFLPTFAFLSGTPLPTDRILDGKDITAMLKAGSDGKSEYKKFFYWSKKNITALRMGNWKLRIRIDNKSKTRDNPELFNLADDLSEANNLASQMPDKVAQMSKILYQAETDQLTNSQK
jgi:arylsulfatase A